MVEISGRCDAGFGAVKDAFAANFANNGDVGASCAVVKDGELVVDLWGGTLDAEGTTPWAEDTLINVYSTTKTMSCLSLLVLVSRGLVDVDAPVCRYWPEFEQADKANVLVRHILSHTAGLPAWDQRLETADLYDWDKVTGLLAAQPTWWEPGWKSGYHGVSQGNLVGEVVRRVDGRSVGAFFAEEIAGPLGADFYIGTGPEHDHRIAPVIPAPPLDFGGENNAKDPESIPYRASNPRLVAEDSWTIPWRRAEIPAAGGHGNARGVALAQCPVSAGGSARGVDLLSAETRRTHIRRSSRRSGPGAGGRRHIRRGLRAQLTSRAHRPERTGLLLGWLGRLAGCERCRRRFHHGLRHEPDGTGHRR